MSCRAWYVLVCVLCPVVGRGGGRHRLFVRSCRVVRMLDFPVIAHNGVYLASYVGAERVSWLVLTCVSWRMRWCVRVWLVVFVCVVLCRRW